MISLCAGALLLFEAVIRLPGGDTTTHVTTEAKDFYTARDRIEKTYCGAPTHASSCIVEGPWQTH